MLSHTVALTQLGRHNASRVLLGVCNIFTNIVMQRYLEKCVTLTDIVVLIQLEGGMF